MWASIHSYYDIYFIELITLFTDLNTQHISIRWQFLTEDHAISFGVFRKTDDKHGDLEEIYKSAKCSSHLFPEDGSITCQQPGTCKQNIYLLKTKIFHECELY